MSSRGLPSRVLATLALALACCAEPEGDYRIPWEARTGESPWQRVQGRSAWVRGDYSVRAVLPQAQGPAPGLHLWRHRELRSVTLDGEALPQAYGASGYFLLPPDHAGRTLEARYHARTWTTFGRHLGEVGPVLSLWQPWVLLELPNVAVGALLVLLGAGLLAAGAARRGEVQPWAWLGLYAAPLGWVFLANTRLADLALPLPRLWQVSAGIAGFAYPAGLALFAVRVFGDGPWRPLRWAAVASAALLGAAVLSDTAGLLSYEQLQPPVYALLLFVIAWSFRRAWPAARSGDRPARAFLAGELAALVLGAPDIARDLGLDVGAQNLAPLGQLLFVFGMGAAVAAQVQDQRRRLTEASSELAARLEALGARTREVQSLNVELRRQVAERSRDLEKALGGTFTPVPGSTNLASGDVFGGRFRVEQLLGQGGMGAVYAVTRLADGKALALKVMTGPVDAHAGRRFAREAEIAARLQHPRLVAVLDVGVTDAGTMFLAMERVHGRSLEAERARFGQAAWALPLLADAAEGLAALHDFGVVHRDLKPANVLLEDAGPGETRAKLSDFGIARWSEHDARPDALADTAPGAQAASPALSGGHLTRSGAMMGTPMYMAPELARGAQRAQASSDVFSFGVMCWEVLGGQRPWPDPPIFHVLGGHTLRPPTRPLPGLGPAGALILRALDPDPGRRPGSPELARALRDAARGEASAG